MSSATNEIFCNIDFLFEETLKSIRIKIELNQIIDNFYFSQQLRKSKEKYLIHSNSFEYFKKPSTDHPSLTKMDF